MVEEHEIRSKLAAVAAHALSLDKFAEWIDGESMHLRFDSPEGASSLALSILSLLSERNDGVLDDDELRSQLLLLLNNVSESVEIGDNYVFRLVSFNSASDSILAAGQGLVPV